jgi:hypothetical protein
VCAFPYAPSPVRTLSAWQSRVERRTMFVDDQAPH